MSVDVGSVEPEELELDDLSQQKELIEEKPPSESKGEEEAKRILENLTATEKGLTTGEVQERKARFGLNVLPKKKSLLCCLLSNHKPILYGSSSNSCGILCHGG